MPVVLNGVRGCGYLFLHLMETEQPLPTSVLTPFVRVSMKKLLIISVIESISEVAFCHIQLVTENDSNNVYGI